MDPGLDHKLNEKLLRESGVGFRLEHAGLVSFHFYILTNPNLTFHSYECIPFLFDFTGSCPM